MENFESTGPVDREKIVPVGGPLREFDEGGACCLNRPYDVSPQRLVEAPECVRSYVEKAAAPGHGEVEQPELHHPEHRVQQSSP